MLTDQYMGWSSAGNTRLKYQHYFPDDGINAMLLADGLPVATAKGATKGLLKPKHAQIAASPTNQIPSFVLNANSYYHLMHSMKQQKKLKKPRKNLQS